MTAPTTPARSTSAAAAEHASDTWPSRGKDEATPCPSRRQITRMLFTELANTTNERERRALRQRLVEHNMPVAAAIARRYTGRGASQEDLEQVAYVGLIKAVRRFDPTRDNDFSSYAAPTVAGELKRYFRDCCWTVRPPRRIQEMQSKIPAARERLAQSLGREPELCDIAQALGVPESDVADAMAATGCFTPSSLDAPAAASAVSQFVEHRLTGLARCEDHVFVTQLLQDISADDREILHYRYVEGLTQQQIAERIGVTQMQVSRMLSRILRDLGEQAAC